MSLGEPPSRSGERTQFNGQIHSAGKGAGAIQEEAARMNRSAYDKHYFSV